MPTVRFATYSKDVAEGGVLQQQVVLSSASDKPVTVVIEGAAYRDGDMQISPQTLVFQPGQTSLAFTATTVDDRLYEGNEIFSYRITSVTNAEIDKSVNAVSIYGGGEFLGYIIDNDTPGGGAAGQVLVATASNATLLGGSNSDTITGLAGANFLRGNEGEDLIQGGNGFDDAHGNVGNDTVRGGGGDDWVVGGKDNDLLFGEDDADIVYGNLGADTCNGGAGADLVRGGQEDDILHGGAGDDWISGDRGSDTVTGGTGADIFNFFAGAGADRIADFDGLAGDRIRFEGSSLAYTAVTIGGDTRLDFGGGDQILLIGVTNLQVGWILLAG